MLYFLFRLTKSSISPTSWRGLISTNENRPDSVTITTNTSSLPWERWIPIGWRRCVQREASMRQARGLSWRVGRALLPLQGTCLLAKQGTQLSHHFHFTKLLLKRIAFGFRLFTPRKDDYFSPFVWYSMWYLSRRERKRAGSYLRLCWLLRGWMGHCLTCHMRLAVT